MKIVWSNVAVKQLSDFLEWIAQDSIIQAERIESEIITEIEGLPLHPKRFPSDKFKLNNGGEFRAFERFSVRIYYKITPEQLQILRIRHVKQNPKKF
ncbi:type II toxin-antitoxin system RelE/ParE family toxin [Algoriphagus yeomjeoni]|uniref:type II toxin-antitoxin system RelE/ParE family toxin n=1 Tax=Algoriphagus yeomjeoni TaxID=291403 RepID=UPI003CE46174